jgi:hypothetical protein
MERCHQTQASFAVINHYGTILAGWTLRFVYENWGGVFRFNDEKVSSIKNNAVVTDSPIRLGNSIKHIFRFSKKFEYQKEKKNPKLRVVTKTRLPHIINDLKKSAEHRHARSTKRGSVDSERTQLTII